MWIVQQTNMDNLLTCCSLWSSCGSLVIHITFVRTRPTFLQKGEKKWVPTAFSTPHTKFLSLHSLTLTTFFRWVLWWYVYVSIHTWVYNIWVSYTNYWVVLQTNSNSLPTCCSLLSPCRSLVINITIICTLRVHPTFVQKVEKRWVPTAFSTTIQSF